MMLADIKKCNVFAHLCRIDPSGSTNFYEGLKAGWPDGGGMGGGGGLQGVCWFTFMGSRCMG